MFHLLTSLLLALSLVWAESPAIKHRRGEGLLAEKPAVQPNAKAKTTQTPGSASKSAEGRTLDKDAQSGQTQSEPRAATPASEQSACEGVSLAALFALQEARMPDVAAEGAFYLRRENGKGQLMWQVAANQAPQALQTLPDVQAFRASPDRKNVFVLSPVSGRRTMALWQGEGKPLVTVAADGVVSAAVWSPDGKWIAFTSNRTSPTNFELFKYDIATKATTLLMNLLGYNEVKDISPDGKSIAILHTDSRRMGEMYVWQAGRITRRWGHEVDAYESEAAFTADSKSMFFTVIGSPGTSQLMMANLATEATKPLETQNGPVEHIRLSEDRLRMAIVNNIRGVTEIRGWELDEQGRLYRSVKLPKPGGVVLDAAAVLNGSQPSEIQFFFTRSTPSSPSQLYFWNGKSEEPWSPVGRVGRAQSVACGPAPTSHTLPARIAEGIHAFQYLPSNAQPSTPFVIWLHGGPDEQSRPGFDPTLSYLISRGYGVLALNPRGSSGYGRGFERYDNGSSRGAMAEDVTGAAQWIRSERKTANLPVFIYAKWSGAWLGAQALAKNPEAFRALVAVDPIWDPPKWMAELAPYERKLWFTEWQGTPAITPPTQNTLTVQTLTGSAEDQLAAVRQSVEFFEQRTVVNGKK
jgi:dipeptidyl aminopeptidase/acylaminoacyl peptidase